jgi:hypothetical protein
MKAQRVEELHSIRLLLRCLVLWGRQKSESAHDEVNIFTYGNGTM